MLFLERHERNNILKHNTKNEHCMCMVFFDHFIRSSFSSFQAKFKFDNPSNKSKWINHVNCSQNIYWLYFQRHYLFHTYICSH